jgi:gliding motility-associated protein GldM
MAGGKETPRQKMIGMMYLVLTALLAMNISKDVLEAFIQINKGLTRTNLTLEEKAEATLKALQNPKKGEEAKTKPFADKALEVDKMADDVIAYIEEMKARVIASSIRGNKDGSGFEEYFKDGKAIDPGAKNEDGKPIITKPDENQNNTTLLVGPDPKSPRTDPFSANELKRKLEGYRDQLMSINLLKADSSGKSFTLPEDVKQAITSSFMFEKGLDHSGVEAEWETHNFFHMPLVAVIANLSKIQTDVMTTKNNVVTALAQGVNAEDVKFTDITVAVVPKQSYVLRGDEFVAEIYLAAYNKTNKSKVYMGGEYSGEMPTNLSTFESGNKTAIEAGPDGKCVFKVNTGGMSLGDHGYLGQIEYVGGDGTTKAIPFAVPPFYVGEPALVVSPVQMNVFYRGLDNPVEISVPGVGADKIQASCDGCKSFGKGQGGTWNVQPGDGQKATISVTANINGENKSIGNKEFRIKRIPDPVPSFNGKRPTDGTITLSDARVAPGIRAEMENFDFNVTVKVKSFKMTVTKGGSFNEDKSAGNQVTGKMQDFLKAAKTGDRIFLEEIKVDMPDGTERKLSPITLKIV